MPDVRKASPAAIMRRCSAIDHRNPVQQVRHGRDDGEVGMKNQVKHFAASSREGLEESINEFLSQFMSNQIELVSFHFHEPHQTTASMTGTYTYVAWVVYRSFV